MQRLPAAVLTCLRRQFGVVARHQLREWINARTVDSLVYRGELVRLHRGVYHLLGAHLSTLSLATAAWLRVAGPVDPATAPDRAPMVSGPFVLGLHNVDGFTTRDPFTVLVRRGHRARPPNIDLLPTGDIDTGRTRFGTLPVADVTRSLCEVAGLPDMSPRRLRTAIHHAAWRGQTSPHRLVSTARRLTPRHPGAATVLSWAESGGFLAGSAQEHALVEALQSLGVDVEQQAQLTPRDRVDVAVPSVRLVFEYDGAIDHGDDDVAADIERDRRLAERGWRVIRVRSEDLGDSARLRAWLRERIRRRALELGVPSPV